MTLNIDLEQPSKTYRRLRTFGRIHLSDGVLEDYRGPEVSLWEISNRGHFSDSERFISTCSDLQEHGRHPKSLQDSLSHRYCVPRALNSSYHVLIETRGSDVGSTPFHVFFSPQKLP